MNPRSIVYVDVDETLIRNYGRSRIPIPSVIRKVREIHQQGATLYCWSSGGDEYSRESTRELGIEECFIAFLLKPTLLIIDDQPVQDWKGLVYKHPNSVDNS